MYKAQRDIRFFVFSRRKRISKPSPNTIMKKDHRSAEHIRYAITFVILLLCVCGSMAQVSSSQDASRDYKSSLYFNGTHCAFTISPSGEFWMSDRYKMWHAHGMSSNWKQVPHPVSYAVDMSYVVCPDSNTVLIFGRLFNPSDSNSHYNAYMRSSDGGKSWDFLRMPLCMQPDNVWVEGRKSGKVWLRIDDILFLSTNKGLYFQEIARFPGGLLKFDMDNDGLRGIATQKGKDHEGKTRDCLLVTRDNWVHYETIPTPVDQLPDIERSNYVRFHKVCGSILVVEQADRYFWTFIDTIRWREIPLNIRDMAVDRESDEWVMVTRENLLLRSTDLRTFDTLNPDSPCLFKVIKHADRRGIYGFIYNDLSLRNSRDAIDSLYRFSTDGLTAYGLYTDEYEIAPCRFFPISQIKDTEQWELKANGVRVGLESSHDVILYDHRNRKWYRHLRTPFPVRDMEICKDELAGNLLLSDGAHQYLVPVDTSMFTPFHYERPLDEFLKSPVTTIDIVLKGSSCDGRSEQSLVYELKGSNFVVKTSSLSKKEPKFVHALPADQLSEQLNALNRDYDAPIRAADFGFTQEDYDSLRRFLFSKSGGFFNFDLFCDSVTNERIFGMLPHLDDSLWNDAIKSHWYGNCTSRSTLIITFRNRAGKSLIIHCTDDACGYGHFPYRTPFQVQCGRYIFPSASIPFMRFIGENLPPSMTWRNFSHFMALMKAYRYILWHRELFGI